MLLWQHSVDIASTVLANAGYLSANHAIAASETSTMANEDRPTEREIREGIVGNFCRCTGYQHIVNAIQYAANKR